MNNTGCSHLFRMTVTTKYLNQMFLHKISYFLPEFSNFQKGNSACKGSSKIFDPLWADVPVSFYRVVAKCLFTVLLQRWSL